jgi:uncharacterized membrane protein YfcA
MHLPVLMIIAVVCAYLVKGMCGFANTLIFTSILSFQSRSVNITPVDLLLGIPSNILLAFRERRYVRLRSWLPLAVMVIAGAVPGIFLLKSGSDSLLKLILGTAIAGIGVEMLLRSRQKTKHKTAPAVLLVIGIVSGFLCGLFGIGALLSAYMGRTTENTDEFRGNLCMVFLADNLFRLIVYSTMGIITWDVVKNVLMLIPFMLAGLGTGMLLTRFISEKFMKDFVAVMLIISGISLFCVNL